MASALCLGLLLAGCDSPADSIKQSCVSDGGLHDNKAAPPDRINAECDCLVGSLKNTLNDEQMKQVAEVLKKPEKERLAAVKDLSMVVLGELGRAVIKCRGEAE